MLDNLAADILIAQTTIEKLDNVNIHNQSLIPTFPLLGESRINVIRHIGSLEREGTRSHKHVASVASSEYYERSRNFKTDIL